MSTSIAGRREPELHQREQRVAAGEQLRVVAVAAEQLDRMRRPLSATS